MGEELPQQTEIQLAALHGFCHREKEKDSIVTAFDAATKRGAGRPASRNKCYGLLQIKGSVSRQERTLEYVFDYNEIPCNPHEC
jgi:hypothetical protein